MAALLNDLAADLAHPPDAGGAALLLELWRHVEITLICRRPPDLEDHPDLPVRVRGAFGRALAALPPPVSHRHDPFGRPPPLAVLFGDFEEARGRALPKPFVIDVDIRGEKVIARLRVIGSAIFWATQARDALIAALAGGISIKSESRHRVVLEPEEVLTEAVESLDGVAMAREASLLLRSPLAIRSGSAIGLDPVALANSLVARAAGLAAWQGLALEVDRGAIMACARACKIDAGAAHPVHFRRNSGRQPGRSIPVTGLLGRVALIGPIETLAPYLVLGSLMHAGSHAALGLGRYDLAVYG